jgi:hypothetical protein
MQEYQVPKEKASVLVDLPPHPAEPRFIFLAPFAQNHHGAETPSDIFNVPHAFIPLFREDDEPILVRHDSIVWVKVVDPQRTEWYYYNTRAGAPDAGVIIEFDTGHRLEGRIALIGPVGGQRVLDVINRQEAFLHVEREEDLFLVNLKRVVSISFKEQ